LAFYQRKKEVVVIAAYYYFISCWSFYFSRWKLSVSPLYIFNILMAQNQRIKELETLVAINILFSLLFVLFRLKLLLTASLFLSIFCLLLPDLLQWIDKIWSAIFSLIGDLNTKLLLFLVFFFLLVPIALLMKVFSKKTVSKSSHYKIREHEFGPDDLERMG